MTVLSNSEINLLEVRSTNNDDEQSLFEGYPMYQIQTQIMMTTNFVLQDAPPRQIQIQIQIQKG